MPFSKRGNSNVRCCYRREDDTPRARGALSGQDTYGGEDVDSTTVQFNTEEEAKESEELAVSTWLFVGRCCNNKNNNANKFHGELAFAASAFPSEVRLHTSNIRDSRATTYNMQRRPIACVERIYAQHTPWSFSHTRPLVVGARVAAVLEPECDLPLFLSMCRSVINWCVRQKTLRQLGDSLASDTAVIDLRAVNFWCLAKRERLWADDEVSGTRSSIADCLPSSLH